MARRSPKINRWTKDPVLDEVLDLLHQSPKSWAAVARESGVSVSTLRAWDVGKTQRPQNMSLFLVLRALGYSRKITKD